MTFFDYAALAALLYFGSTAPGQMLRGYRAGIGQRHRAHWWLIVLPSVWTFQIIWLCLPAALIYVIGRFIVAG
jgi:hypothetical protein